MSEQYKYYTFGVAGMDDSCLRVERDDVLEAASSILEVPLARLRELADAEKDGRVVVLPVDVDKLAYTPEGDAIVKNWDITARVEFCVPHRSGMYWCDRYSDFDILDILNPEAEAARALAEPKGEATT